MHVYICINPYRFRYIVSYRVGRLGQNVVEARSPLREPRRAVTICAYIDLYKYIEEYRYRALHIYIYIFIVSYRVGLLGQNVVEARGPLARAEARGDGAVVDHVGHAARVHVRVERVDRLDDRL